jgi:hypothetical protein
MLENDVLLQTEVLSYSFLEFFCTVHILSVKLDDGVEKAWAINFQTLLH